MVVNDQEEFEKVVSVSWLPVNGEWSREELSKYVALHFFINLVNGGILMRSRERTDLGSHWLYHSRRLIHCVVSISEVSLNNTINSLKDSPNTTEISTMFFERYSFIFLTLSCSRAQADDGELWGVLQALDNLLIQQVSENIQRRLAMITNLSQLAQIVVNVLFFQTACTDLETLLVTLRFAQLVISQSLGFPLTDRKKLWPTQSHSKRRNDPSRLPFLFLSNPSNHSRSYHFPNLLENGFVLWRSRVSLDFLTTSTTSCTRGSEWVFDGFDGFLKYRYDERFDSITRVCKGLRVSRDFKVLFNGFNCTSLTLLYFSRAQLMSRRGSRCAVVLDG